MALLNWELCGSLLKRIFSRASADSALSENEPAGRPSAHQLTAWRCERCGEWQHHSLVFCHSCGTIRPDPIGPAMAKAESTPDTAARGAWNCEKCGEAHDASLVFCRSCGELRPDQNDAEKHQRCRTCGQWCKVDQFREPEHCPKCGDVLKASPAERGNAPEEVRDIARQFFWTHSTSSRETDWPTFLRVVRYRVPARTVADWEVKELFESEAELVGECEAQKIQEKVREAARRFIRTSGGTWGHRAWLTFLADVRSMVPESLLGDSEVGDLLESEASLLRRCEAESRQRAAQGRCEAGDQPTPAIEPAPAAAVEVNRGAGLTRPPHHQDDKTRSMSPNEALAQAPGHFTGAILAGRYKLEMRLSTGGFGEVYRARDEQLLSKLVVVKILKNPENDPWFVKKFSQEKEALARIRHHGVVEIVGDGVTSDGRPFLVMQYVEGVTLRAVIRPGGMSFIRAAGIVQQISRALSVAHHCGVCHRDLKPENVMLQTLDGDEHVVLIDFGIAGVADSRFAGITTKVAGSLAYMAPEQFEGKGSIASDIYALGVVAFEMLTGVLPTKGAEAKLRTLRPDLPEPVAEAILKALSPDPAQRFRSVREFGTGFGDQG